MGGDAGLKAIAKRTKASGLGRLRWYCQMCEKQCRDENGFKCHTNTPAHQRQLVLFANQPDLFVERFSEKFLSGFLAVLRQHGTNAVAANNVYQEYIKDKHHIHMNSTRWTTLTDFVKDLGRRGVCRVEYRDEAFWIVYIDREAMERKRRAQEMDRARLDEEERAEQALARQMRSVSDREVTKEPESGGHFDVANSGPLQVPLRKFTDRPLRPTAADEANNAFDTLASTKVVTAFAAESSKQRRRKQSVLDEIIEEERIAHKEVEEVESLPGSAHLSTAPDATGGPPTSKVAESRCGPKSDGQPRRPASASKSAVQPSELQKTADLEGSGGIDETPWIATGIVVKCVGSSLAGTEYHKKKGTIEDILNEYAAVVKLHDTGAVLQLDQDDLQTVIPKPRGRVMFLKGSCRGRVGAVESINEDRFTVTVRLDGVSDHDTAAKGLVRDVEYEDVSKLAPTAPR